MESILLSIIIPVYNVENYLHQCLYSVVNQDYSNIEIILINDGSTDNSLAICYEFQNNYKNIIVQEQQNSGQSIARNNGIKIAKGDYICFIDSDDWIDENSISYLMNIISNEEVEMLEFSLRFYFEKTKKIKETSLEKIDFESTDGKNHIIRNKRMTPEACLYVYNTSFLKRNHLFFQENLVFEDEYFNWECFLKLKSIKKTALVSYNYRIRENSTMTSKPSILKINSYFKLMEKIEEVRKLDFIDAQYYEIKMSQYVEQLASSLAISNLSFVQSYKIISKFKKIYSKRNSYPLDSKRIYFEKKLYNNSIFLYYLYLSNRSIQNDSFFDLLIFKTMKIARYFHQLISK